MKKIYLFLSLIGLSATAQTVSIQNFVSGLSSPVALAHAGDERLFVVEQGGRIKIIQPTGTVNATPFLQLPSSLLTTGGEQGLLGLAFHPDYASNGYFYLNYTNSSGDTVIARYSVSSGNPDLADSTSGSVLLTIDQPYSNHNGGTLQFGPDGYLYIGMGDGGSGGDPQNRAQNINSLLGKMLRIDVDGASPYAIPPDNPYVGVAGADEIWAVGLRNPWKFSFDSETGDLWIADVGQGEVEEINKVGYTEAGLNYGWKCYEGNSVYSSCTTPGVTYEMPFAQYTHSGTGGCSITGGYVYRGSAYPNFVGKYFFADYCLNRIGYVNDSGAITYSSFFSGNNNFTSFGEDVNGELYAVGSGKVVKIVDSSMGVGDFGKGTVSLYPNPAKGSVMVKTEGMSFPARLEIHDVAGKRLSVAALSLAETRLDVSGLATGIYFVNVTDALGSKLTQRLAVE